MIFLLTGWFSQIRSHVYTVKEENHAGQILCVLRLNTPLIHIVQILIVRLIHCYDVLIFILIFLGTGTT